jgi:hypothetical protein
VAGDLAHGPAFGVVQAVDFVDRFATQHGFLVTERQAESQRGVVGKKSEEGPAKAQGLENQDLAASQVVVGKNLCPWPQQPNLGHGTF